MNMKKVPWVRLAVQVIALASIVPYMSIGKFKQVFDSLNIELPAFSAFILYPPGLYLHPAVVICAFALFLWSWKTDRLENKLLAVLCNLPILTILAVISALLGPG
jgi:type II secretory pathway component PulF